MTKAVYGPAMLQRIRAGAEAGKTREQIARTLKITARALYDLAKKHPEIDEAFAAKVPEHEKYNSTVPHQVLYMVAVGNKTIPQMAADLGISEKTWHVWLEKYPEFAKAADSGKKAVLGRVAGSLIDRATKQTTVIEKEVKYQLKRNPEYGKTPGAEEYTRVPYEEVERHKIHLPDIAAQKHLLGNLDRDMWNADGTGQTPDVPKREPTAFEKKWMERFKTMDPKTKILLDKMELDRPDIFMRFRRTGDSTELLSYIKELDGGTE